MQKYMFVAKGQQNKLYSGNSLLMKKNRDIISIIEGKAE